MPHQPIVTSTAPLKNYLPTLTILARVFPDFYNELLTKNRALVIEDEHFNRDAEAFELGYHAEIEELRRFESAINQVVYA